MLALNRFLITIVLLLVACDSYVQDTIYWNKAQPLTWGDFKGNPPTNNSFLASSAAGIGYTVRLSGTTISIVAKAYFIRSHSWKKHRADSTILQHEQGHFDITEIFARRINAIATIPRPGIIPLADAAKANADKLIDEKNKTQILYDSETKNGTNTEAQFRWLLWIKKELGN